MNLFHNDASAVSYSPGDLIFRLGDPSNHQMFAVGDGEVDIQLNGKTLETLRPGAIFGEMGLIDNLPRSADAVSKTAAKVVPINERRFIFLVQNNPYFALHVLRTMTERIRRLSGRLG